LIPLRSINFTSEIQSFSEANSNLNSSPMM
jgi:hypothetical protein